MTERDTERHDIAVIGLACRFPGADGPEAYWRLLCEGADAVRAAPEGRPAARPSGRGGFLAAVDGFDAEFFGVSPREARRLDPHQRLVLELGWEGLEDAGIVPGTLRGGRTAVVVGVANDEWRAVLRDAGGPDDLHALTGAQRAMAAGRLSHFLGVGGPSLTVDTGQSSSLTAVHLACRALRDGEADLAVAGGVSLMLDDGADRVLAASGALSPGGRCRVFDAGADGFVRGEGGGMVVLKPLAAALADGDRVHAVLRGSAVNHDGGAGALTVPDAAAQESLLRSALADAATDAAGVGYVELHGTGTVAGDPVEAAALGAVFGAGRPAGRPLAVGSAKTNIGHLEAAAGVAGLIKAVLAVEHGRVPATLHFTAPNPLTPLADWGLRPQTAPGPWPGDGPRIAGVSSFGMGGSNAHVVVAEAPAGSTAPTPGDASGDGAGAGLVWPLSGRTTAALRAQAAALRDRLLDGDGTPLADLASALAFRRTAFAARGAVVATERADVLDALRTLADGPDRADGPDGPDRPDGPGQVVAGPDADPALLALARRYAAGETVDWPASLPAGRHADLPTYRFRRARLWPAATAAAPEAPEAPEAPTPSASLALPAFLRLVRRETAAVLEHADADAIAPDLTFEALGTDSLTVVELTERLAEATGLPLPGSLVFDHPTPRAVADFLARTAAATPAPEAGASPTPTPTPEAPAPPTPRPLDASAEPLAIVGIGCRFPGGIRSADDLWELVAGERDVVGDFPTDRGWDLDRLFSAEPGTGGTSGPRQGGFLHDAAGFDAAFFGISPREALAMDPQQRLLLEVGWEAVEHAGLDPLALRGTPAGVFMGVIPQQYDTVVQRSGEDLDGYVYTGSTTSVLAGRLAYTLGLEGPALAVDTACSSSLAALHLAGRALRAGECDLALAGGVTVMSTPTMFTDFTAQGALSPDGRSKAFGADADGTGWSEGVGVLVLERLADARRAGHRVLAVVRGSALNEDGASNGLTAPHGPAQQRVVRAALADAGVPAAEVDAVEAHGPGTRLGDPIEANALIATYGTHHTPDRPLWLGSVKSNLGHTQAAAGVAGVIKMVMAMRHGVLPRTLNADLPTPRVDWSAGTVRVLSGARPWPAPAGRPRRAGVSAFGAGGTNAHVVLEAAPDPAPQTPPVPATTPVPATPPATAPARPLAFPVAARSAVALTAQARRLRAHLADRPDLPLADIARALAGRSALPHRAVVTATTRAEVLDGLAAVVAEPGPAPLAGDTAVFVFPGQGAQWPGMAAGLLDADPVFTATAHACAAAFAPYLDWSLLDVLRRVPGTPPPDRVDVVQPALFTVMVSLAALWRARGIEPGAVVGHSQGEIAAAHVAGALTLDDAARVVALRSRALLGFSGHGAMAAVSLPADALRERLLPWDGDLAIAAVNGPESTTVGGAPGALDALLDALDADGVRFRRLPVSNAGHSAQIEPLREHLLEALAPVAPRASAVPFYSTVTGGPLATTALDTHYWWRNARLPVLLEPAVRALLDAGHRTFVEVNPHPLLRTALEETFDAAGVTAAALGTLRRDEDPATRFTLALADAFRAGLPVDWRAGNAPGPVATLPPYAFQPRRFWPRTAPAAPALAETAGGGGTGHPVLTAGLSLPHTGGHVFTGRLSPRDLPWLADHALRGEPLVPGTLLAELAHTAARLTGGGDVAELVLEAPVPLTGDAALAVQVAVGAPGADGERAVTVHTRPGTATPDAPWTRHAHGTLTSAGGAAPLAEPVWPPEGAREADLSGAYDELRRAGYTYGPAFRGLRRLWRRGTETFAEAALGAAVPAGEFAAHPALLDMALHAVLLTSGTDTPARMPFVWTNVRLYAPGETAVRIRIRPVDGETHPATAYAVEATGPSGRPVAGATVTFRPAPGGTPPLRHRAWEPAVLRTGGPLGAGVTVLGPPLPALPDAPRYDTVEALTPGDVVVVHQPRDAGDAAGLPARVREATARHLGVLRALLTDARFGGSRIVLAVADATGDDPDLVGAAVAGLWRSAAAEHPGQVALVDSDGSPASRRLLPAAVAARQPELALRGGVAHAPVLRALPDGDRIAPPSGPGAWKLALTGPAATTTPDRLALVPAPEYDGEPGPGRVKVAVRAAGLNFVDVITTMGLFPGTAALGREFAGVVTAVGAGVTGVAPGDRVMGIVGLTSSAIAPAVITDARLVAPVPSGWSFARAAGVPIAYLTAYYGMVVLGGLRRGESLLVHAATGGVGMAALHLARHLGARVYATAHPDKWPVLAGLDVPADRTASSRSLDFEERLRAVAPGGVDMVLNSLTGEFVDASLRLLAPGGRFMEMGKLDIRGPGAVGAVRADVHYDAFDILSADPDAIAAMFDDLLTLFADGSLPPLPVTARPVTDAREVFRRFRDARHTGKLVLTLPAAPDPDGTVLITGGTGTLGGELARHLVRGHGVRRLLLAGGTPEGASRSAGLRDELAALGAHVTVHTGDLSTPDGVDALLAAVPPGHPLTAVVHAAGALRDATVTRLTEDHLAAVLGPKADAAWWLHLRTRDLDLAGFTLYGSVAGTLGLPGQGNYAAANAFLDALAAHRASRGLEATAIAWGLWEDASALSGHLRERDLGRMAEAGLLPLSTADGLALYDAATARRDPGVVAVRVGTTPPAAPSGAGAAPVAEPSGAVTAPQGLRERLADLAPERRTGALTAWLCERAAAVLRLPDDAGITPTGAFRDLGFDSLTSVELRNHVNSATGLRLPVTAVFDHPTPGGLAAHIAARMFPETETETGTGTAAVTPTAPVRPTLPGDLADVGVDELLTLLDDEFGTPEDQA